MVRLKTLTKCLAICSIFTLVFSSRIVLADNKSSAQESGGEVPDTPSKPSSSLLPSLPTSKGGPAPELTEKLPHCGDGLIDGQEKCDDGNLLGGDGCSAECEIEPEPKCGDGKVNGTDECDDGNTADGDGCSAQCRLEGCGDGRIGSGEQCDDGNSSSGDGCSSSCTVERCGDGEVQAGLSEACDDGNTANGDGCNAACGIESCGDGIIQPGGARGEACDDGNTRGEDGCSVDCRVEFCGDQIVQAGLNEQCDDGNTQTNDGCNACVLELRPRINDLDNPDWKGGCPEVNNSPGICNKHMTRGGECADTSCPGGVAPICEGATACPSSSSACEGLCCYCPVCGNGNTETGEECDDGNTTALDGCSPTCTIERDITSCSVLCDVTEDQSSLNFSGSCQLSPEPPAGQNVAWQVVTTSSDVCAITGFSGTGSTVNFTGVFEQDASGVCQIAGTAQAAMCSGPATGVTQAEPSSNVCENFSNWAETDDDGQTSIPLSPSCGSHKQHECTEWQNDGLGNCSCPVANRNTIYCGAT